MKHSADVIVVGGGIIGCSIAYFLRKQNLDVIVLDKGNIGAQASSAAAGLLAPIRPLSKDDAGKQFQIAGMRRLATLIPELEEISGVQTDYERTGTLRILPAEKIGASQLWLEEWKDKGFQMKYLAPDEVYQLEPLLFPGVCGAMSIADESQVNPVKLAQAYSQAACKMGTIFYEQTEVVELLYASTGKNVTGVCTAKGEVLSCNHLIIAAGAWSAHCGEWLNFTFPVRPVRGEIIALQQPSSPIRHIIFDEGLFDEDIYIAPKPDGTVIVGATKAEVGFDTSVTACGVLHLLDVATRLIPALQHCSIQRMWAGLRPKAPTSQPILGLVPSWDNVTFASGHGGFGVTLSAITGETIAELVTTGQTPAIIRPFAPKPSL